MPVDPLIGEVRLWANAQDMPSGWLRCDGSSVPVAQYTALFSIVGTTYGGDGRTSFMVPDLRDRVIVGPGQGSGLSLYQPGQSGGVAAVTLTETQMPSHNHTATSTPATGVQSSAQAGPGALTAPGDGTIPAGGVFGAAGSTQAYAQYKAAPSTNLVALGGLQASASLSVSAAGNSQPHENRQPYLVMSYYIASRGIYPQRS